jgi:hypothetical protein
MGTSLARFRVIFLNCYNLFEVGAQRGPDSAQTLADKMAHLAATLKLAHGENPPAIVCLCEVGSENLGRLLAEAIAPNVYQTLWSGISDPTQTGLVICYNPEIVQLADIADDQVIRGVGSRCKWFAALFQMKSGLRGLFWLVLNHWKSQMGGELQTEEDRNISARGLGAFFIETARISTEAMVLIGDFNCEPGAMPFKKPNNFLRAVRERSVVLRDRNRLAYFYNPMWRLLGEADAYDMVRQTDYVSPRPPGTIYVEGQGWRTFDQIMVSKELLTGHFIRFIESSVRVTEAQGNCSDHCALSAEFEY